MKKSTKHKLMWIALASAIVLGILWQYYPLPDQQAKLSMFPLVGPGFRGQNVPLSDFEREFFAKVNLFKRAYDIQGQKLFVTALDGTHNRHVVHDPFYCFRGAGWELTSRQSIPVQGGYIDLLKMKRGNETKEALVWFTDGKERHASALTYFLQTTLRRLTLGQFGQEPLLIVVQPLDNGTVDWNKLLQNPTPLLDL